MADPKQYAAMLDEDALRKFNSIEAQGQPFYKTGLPMEGRATFLPFRDTMEGSVFNKRELALPGILAGALNAFTSPARAATGSDPTFNPNEEAANLALNTFGGGIATGKALKAPTGQGGTDLAMNAWHGSPHNIEGKFSLEKVGTGEGAQQYGSGIYFAEARPTAERFRETTKNKGFNFANEEQVLGVELPPSARGQFMQLAQRDIDPMAAAKIVQNANIAARDIAPEKIANLFKTYTEKTKGNLYKVDIPDEQIPKMLDWNKPLSQQSPEVIEILKNSPAIMADLAAGKTLENLTGKNAYQAIAASFDVGEKEAYKLASDYLNKLGIPGIKYKDDFSTGKPASNFVTFQPETVKILEKNDISVNPIKDLSDKWNTKGVDLDVYLSKDGTKINLSKISVDPKQRNQGIGTQVMNDIIQQADNTNAIVTLSPSVDFGGTSVARLKDFYKEFGFVENKGKNKDLSISETMYRKPVQKLPTRKDLLKQEFDKLEK